MSKTPNYAAWKYVDNLTEFTGSNLRGEAYRFAPSAAGSWLNDYEMERYETARPYIVYVVWSFWTPIAYFVEINGKGQWYKVGQSFSSFTGRHRNGALRNVPGHMAVLKERRGHNTVQCFDCGTERHFTLVRDAREAYYLHRN